MPLQTSRVKALCFDVDGTLRDTDDQYIAMFSRFLKYVAFLLPHKDPDRFARRMVMKLETPANFVYNLPDRLGVDDELVAIGDWFHKRRGKSSNHRFLLVDGIRETLTELAPHYPMAVVSARGSRNTLAFLKHYNLLPFFSAVATAQTTPYTKPQPDPVLWAAKQLGVSPANCLMIGDTKVDILAGKAAGAQTLGVLCGFGEEDELREAGADLILESAVSLPKLLLQSGGGQ